MTTAGTHKYGSKELIVWGIEEVRRKNGLGYQPRTELQRSRNVTKEDAGITIYHVFSSAITTESDSLKVVLMKRTETDTFRFKVSRDGDNVGVPRSGRDHGNITALSDREVINSTSPKALRR
jgi:hypothetical protein